MVQAHKDAGFKTETDGERHEDSGVFSRHFFLDTAHSVVEDLTSIHKHVHTSVVNELTCV